MSAAADRRVTRAYAEGLRYVQRVAAMQRPPAGDPVALAYAQGWFEALAAVLMPIHACEAGTPEAQLHAWIRELWRTGSQHVAPEGK